MIFLIRMKKFQKVLFHSDVEDIVQVEEIARTTANDPVHFFHLLHITRINKEVSLKYLKIIMATSTI